MFKEFEIIGDWICKFTTECRDKRCPRVTTVNIFKSLRVENFKFFYLCDDCALRCKSSDFFHRDESEWRSIYHQIIDPTLCSEHDKICVEVMCHAFKFLAPVA